MEKDRILQVNHLSKSFGANVVLRDIDFTVSTGDVTCIIGASGSGKSTLLRCINLLETPTSGEILFHDQPVTGRGVKPNAYRTRVGMVFQSFNLFDNMTVIENCMAGQTIVLKKKKDEARENAMKYLEKYRPDVIILDYTINLYGRALPKNKREIEDIPKIVLCASTDKAVIKQILMGMKPRGFIKKPIDKFAVLSKLEEILTTPN